MEKDKLGKQKGRAVADEFRAALVSLRETHVEFEKDIIGGFGIRPIKVESKIRIDLLNQIIKLYDRHSQKILR